jgi:P4 family phage/plasmid primase-like protien
MRALDGDEPLAVTNGTPSTEFDFANLLKARLPEIKTVGATWHALSGGTWRVTEPDTFKPLAFAVLPEPMRTARRCQSLLDHVAAAAQTSADTFKGFNTFDAGGAVLINSRNGVLRVTVDGVELLPHSADYHFTRQTVATYNPEATAPLFYRVLCELLPHADDRELLKICLGNFLFPDCRYETALVGYGEAGTGKSTVADAVSRALGVDLVCRLSMSQICDPKSYSLPGLRYAAVNLGTELTADAIGESGNFKTLVSGEPIEARPIYGRPFVMQTACKLFFLANSLPRFHYGTEAELRRMRFLRFAVQPAEKDVTLKARLAAECDGVFNFMLDGLRTLLSLPEIPLGGPESRLVHDRFRISNDPAGAFIRTRCVMAPDARVRKDTLKDAFNDFATQHELPRACGEWFFKALYERFTSLRETQPRINGERVRHVRGLQLRATLPVENE